MTYFWQFGLALVFLLVFIELSSYIVHPLL
jgi:hypothetical protein